MTLLSGLAGGLVTFVAARVLTGLGEGAFYSNDRTMVINHTPPARRTLGLGIVLSGLSIGLAVGLLATPYLINWGASLGLGNDAWRMPLWAFGCCSLVVALATYLFFRARGGRPLRLGPAALRLMLYSAPDRYRDHRPVRRRGGAALARLAHRRRRRGARRDRDRAGRAQRGAVRPVRDAAQPQRLDALYIAFIAVLWNLWFFSFWSVQIVKEAAHSSLVAAGRTAAFNAGAGIIGFPIGGWIADRRARQGKGRKPLAIICAVVHTVLAVAFGFTIMDGAPSLVLLGLILFTSGLFFNALQPIVHGILGDLVPEGERGSAFGFFNLVAEIGAVASPVVSGVLRDATGSWAPGVFVAAGVMAVSVVLYALIRERVLPAGAH
jgi:MFS family permease